MSTAQRRWRLLARALTSSGSADGDGVSVRRFASFGLVRVRPLEHPAENGATWCEYSESGGCRVLVRKLHQNFTANELIGFNNTGNVCVWPSEECLAHYLLRNRHLCRAKRLLELGGGMSCLAGVFVAKHCAPTAVTLTDGNPTSVDNVRRIVARNDLAHVARCGVVQWARSAELLRNARNAKTWASEVIDESRRSDGLYDVILCADCLFFDDTRLDLVESIYGLLKDDGVALVMAPRRGNTFQMFVDAAVKRGFVARQTEKYDSVVWSRHLDLLENNLDYCPDIHFPILLELTKQNKMMPPG